MSFEYALSTAYRNFTAASLHYTLDLSKGFVDMNFALFFEESVG